MKERHPVWDVYDEFRTAAYYAVLYAQKLHQTKRLSTSMEIAVAIFTPSSAIASLVLLNTPYGKAVWNTLIVLASCLAIAKPLVRLDKRIDGLQKGHSAWAAVLHALDNLRLLISQEGSYSEKHKDILFDVINTKKAAARRSLLVDLSERRRLELYEEVVTRYPVKYFAVPGDKAHE